MVVSLAVSISNPVLKRSDLSHCIDQVWTAVAISIPQVLQLGSWVVLIMMCSGSLIMQAEHTQGWSQEIRRTSRALARETTAAWKQELWSWVSF